MKFKRFLIQNYKGITEQVEVDIEKNPLIPIIGINECGKTTILNSIYAFDYWNDNENITFKHLNDISNLYTDTSEPCRISAVIEITKTDLRSHIKEVTKYQDKTINDILNEFDNEQPFEITITRNLVWKDEKVVSSYELSHKFGITNKTKEDSLCKEIIRHLPYILYFDDFRETFPDEIEISHFSKESKWLDILERLFKTTNENFSVHDLKNLEERRRKSIISQVKKKLNETLTTQWANFRLENKELLEIDIDFKKEKSRIIVEAEEKQTDGSVKKVNKEQEVEKYYLKFDIIERDLKGNEHYFYVRDRSKGFYWFFNFVMKLEFNPKVAGDQDSTIYLLDEPGSYLHPYAQSKLCKKLKELSVNNIVIYCTHSHYLLNPEIISLNKIHVASKSDLKSIHLDSFYNHKSKGSIAFKTAFETIYDALYIRPFDLDLNNKKILLVEGIYDYYAFSLFNSTKDFGILPGKGADSLINFISIMIAYEKDFRVLWDNDSDGKSGLEKAKVFFGEEISSRHFNLLPSSNGKKTILQDLFNPKDFELIISELGLNANFSFEKKIATLFYSSTKDEIVSRFSSDTKERFNKILESLGLKS